MESRKLFLSVDLQLQLFDGLVIPILLYCAEVCECDNIGLVSHFQIKCCRLLVNLKQSTPNVIVYGDHGRIPFDHIVKSRTLNYLCKFVNSRSDKISFLLYKLMFHIDSKGIRQFSWIS